jgi:hypothetical protein
MVTLQRSDYSRFEWKNDDNKFDIDDKIIVTYLATSLDINT